VPTYNAKYGPRPIGYGSDNAILLEIGKPLISDVWMPVLDGITSHAYNIGK